MLATRPQTTSNRSADGELSWSLKEATRPRSASKVLTPPRRARLAMVLTAHAQTGSFQRAGTQRLGLSHATGLQFSRIPHDRRRGHRSYAVASAG